MSNNIVDVTNPVVINASTAIIRESPFHLRRVCLVSLGMSNLNEGEYTEIFKYNYLEYVKAYTEILTKCRAFFSQADNKGLILLELGSQPGTSLEDVYNSLFDFCSLNTEFNSDNFYKYVYDTLWADKNTEETKDLILNFYNFYQPGKPFEENNYEVYCNTYQLDKENTASLFQYLDTFLPKDWRTHYYRWLPKNSNEFQNLLTRENLHNYVLNINNSFFNQQEYEIYLEERGTKNTDYSEKINNLNTFITNGETPCYIYMLPNNMGEYENLGEQLFSQYSALGNTSYFFINHIDDSKLSEYKMSNVFKQVEGQKSAALFINNIQKSDLAALSAGLFASYKFDLSDTNPASPLNYKIIKGVTPISLTQPLKQQIIQDSLNLLDNIANEVVLLNGRYGDSFSIDYRYQWDLTSFQVSADLRQIILNGVNNPIYIVKYNQSGIDILKSRVKSTLQNMIALGAITEYAMSINPANGELENIGDINVIPFRQYIRSHPEDYEKEIYNGISFYLRIGRYIRQIVLNITLS